MPNWEWRDKTDVGVLEIISLHKRGSGFFPLVLKSVLCGTF
jgi:hypothetical protein